MTKAKGTAAFRARSSSRIRSLKAMAYVSSLTTVASRFAQERGAQARRRITRLLMETLRRSCALLRPRLRGNETGACTGPLVALVRWPRASAAHRRLMTLSTSAGGGLLLQRFTQLVEHARIFNRDHGLGGESLEQLDLLVAEWADLSASDDNGTDGNARTDQRDLQ